MPDGTQNLLLSKLQRPFPLTFHRFDFASLQSTHKAVKGEYLDFSSAAKVAQLLVVGIFWSEIWVNLDQSGCGGVCVGGWLLS